LSVYTQQELLDKATQVPQPNEHLLKVPLALYGNTSSGGGVGGGAVATIMEGVPEQPAAAAAAPTAAGAPAAGVGQ
jgi:hypothetical protein